MVIGSSTNVAQVDSLATIGFNQSSQSLGQLSNKVIRELNNVVGGSTLDAVDTGLASHTFDQSTSHGFAGHSLFEMLVALGLVFASLDEVSLIAGLGPSSR